MSWKKWQQVEQKYQMPMRDVLIFLYKKHGSHKCVALELDTTIRTLNRWRKQAGCEAKVRIDC